MNSGDAKPSRDAAPPPAARSEEAGPGRAASPRLPVLSWIDFDHPAPGASFRGRGPGGRWLGVVGTPREASTALSGLPNASMGSPRQAPPFPPNPPPTQRKVSPPPCPPRNREYPVAKRPPPTPVRSAKIRPTAGLWPLVPARPISAAPPCARVGPRFDLGGKKPVFSFERRKRSPPTDRAGSCRVRPVPIYDPPF